MTDQLFTRYGTEPTSTVRFTEKAKPYFLEKIICSRCGGDGVWKGHYRGVCFGCGGQGDKGSRQVKLYTVEQNAKLDAAAEKRRLKRVAISEKHHASYVERRTFAREVFDAEFPGVDYQLEVIAGTDFGDDLAAKLEEYGSLSSKQVDAVIASADRLVAEAAAKSPVIEGRIEITGQVLTTKVQHSDFGSTLKMLVADDRGFKVWGSVPRAISVDRGDRVTFTAAVTVSDDDETFGFFKRPTKASVIDEQAAA